MRRMIGFYNDQVDYYASHCKNHVVTDRKAHVDNFIDTDPAKPGAVTTTCQRADVLAPDRGQPAPPRLVRALRARARPRPPQVGLVGHHGSAGRATAVVSGPAQDGARHARPQSPPEEGAHQHG